MGTSEEDEGFVGGAEEDDDDLCGWVLFFLFLFLFIGCTTFVLFLVLHIEL